VYKLVIKAFSFERNSLKNADVKRAVTDVLSESGVYFESFGDPNGLFTAISASLDTADALLIGVDVSMYLKFKPVLIKAFHFTPAYSEKIDAAIGSAITDEQVRKVHSLVPNESCELVSADGLYSGFYIRSGEQTIVCFPLSADVVPAVLQQSDLPFVRGAGKPNEAARSEAPAEVVALVTNLVKNDLRLAIPTTPAAKLLRSEIQACDNYESHVYFTPFVNDDGANDGKQYTAQLAKGAMELRGTELGAAISNIYREKKGDEVKSYYTFISVAVAEKVVIKKLFADADENVENLLTEATAELCAMIDKYAGEIVSKRGMTDEEREKYEIAQMEAEIKDSGKRPVSGISKRATIIAMIIILLALILCVIVGFALRGTFISKDTKQTESYLNAANSESATFSPTLPGQSIQNTVSNPASLSDLVTELNSDIFTPSTSTTVAIVTGSPATVSPDALEDFRVNGGGSGGSSSGNGSGPVTPATAAPTEAPTAAPTEPPTTAAPAGVTDSGGNTIETVAQF